MDVTRCSLPNLLIGPALALALIAAIPGCGDNGGSSPNPDGTQSTPVNRTTRETPPPRPDLAAQALNAMIAEDEDLAIQLVEQGAPVEHEYDRGVMTLHYAARATMPRLTRVLLEFGADPNVRMANGQTPMHWAARAGGSDRPNSKETIEVLLEYGGDINAVSDGGTRPIDFAFELKNEAWAEYLVSKGAKR